MTGGSPGGLVSLPLLLLHGALGSADQMRGFEKVFDGERQVFVIDFSGHGRNADDSGKADSSGGFTIGRFAADVRALLDANGIRKADVFGYSMGGYVGLHVARHHPDRIGSVMTLGTKFAWDPATAGKEAARLDPEVLEAKVPAFAAQLRERHGGDWATVVRSTAGMMRGLGAAQDLTADDLRAIPHRALIAVGDRDAMVSIAESSLPAGECLVLPATPHPFEHVNYDVLAYHARHFFSKGQSE
jgi:pimeloyl-ACP methyl ester carboxylesterase